MKLQDSTKKTNKTTDEIAVMLGSSPGPLLRRMILDEYRQTGADLREIIAKYNLPEIAIIDADGKFSSSDYGRITPAEWYEKNPLGKFGRLQQIVTRKH